MLYKTVKVLLRFLTLFIFRLKTEGKKNVLPEGGAILAVNHRSWWDALIILMTSPRRLAFMAKSELFKNKLLGSVIRAFGAFPVKRGKGDIGAVKTSLQILNSGNVMMMCPEGTRVKEGEHAEIKPGVAMLATHAKVPVIPVCITGKYRWMHKITVSYGEPIYLDEYYGEKLSIEKLKEISEFIMDRVYSLGKNTGKNK